MNVLKNKSQLWLFLSCVFTGLLFFIDLKIQLGIAFGATYLFPLLISTFTYNRKYILFLSITCTVLVIIGLYASPPSPEAFKAYFNRGLTIIIIWLSTVSVLMFVHSTEKLEQHDRRLRNILDSMFPFLGIFTTDGVLIEQNKAPLEVAGMTYDEVIGQPFIETYWWSYSTETQQRIKAAMQRAAQGETVRYDEIARIGEGQFITVDLAFCPLFDESGNISQIIGSGVDITERKHAEEMLHKSEEKFRQLVEDTNVMSWEADINTFQFTYISPQTEKITGYTAEDWYRPNFWADHIYTEDQDTAINFCLEQTKSNHDHVFEYRLVKADGDLIWIHDSVKIIYDVFGNPEKLRGVMINITEQKNAQDKLLKSEARFRSIFEQAAVGVALVDSNTGRFVRINQCYCDIVGYTQDEMLNGITFKDITHPEDLSEQIDYMEIMNSGDITEYTMEKRYIHKNGNTIWVSLTVSPTWIGNEKSNNYIAVVVDITESKRTSDLLNFQASHDTLTELVNRREFEQRANRLLSSVKKDNGQHALCFMDLDQFKIVNDTCGHTAGDEMLKQISNVLQRAVRHRDTLARLGGDEFGILIEHCSIDDAQRVAQVILKSIQDFQFIWEGRSFKVGVSIGLVPITEKTIDLTKLLSDADIACYMAKDLGRNRVYVYQADNAETSKRHGEMQWVVQLNQALEEDRFCLYAQSIVPLKHSNHHHYELLIRMIDENNEIIPPGAFLPAAERYNLISKLDRWVVNHAFNLLIDNPSFLQKVNFCSINISGQSLAEDDFQEYVTRLLVDKKIPPGKICFEITETAAITSLRKANLFISKLKLLGCRFALDDFGSGLSSFGYLKNMDVDYLKIDGIFVKDIVHDPIDHAMVKSINEIGQVMGMKTIAEFVENDEIKEMLNEIGVDYVQGYGVGKPQPFDDLLSQTNNITNIKSFPKK